MGINVKVQKAPKLKDIVVEEAKLEKDLKSCMRCKFFHGNSRQCILKKCIKEEKKQPEITEEEKQSKLCRCRSGYLTSITDNKVSLAEPGGIVRLLHICR